MNTERALLSVALALLARGEGDGSGQLTPAEQTVAASVAPCADPVLVDAVLARILAGDDPLGEAFCLHRNALARRRHGQVLTPTGLVDAMMVRAQAEATRQGEPARVVDGGAGTGRFLLKSARLFPKAALIGIEQDPLCTLLLRANLQAAGLTERSQVVLADYRDSALPDVQGWTLHIGNPPYVRHHDIPAHWKTWYVGAATALGHDRASKLAGLHLHFFVKTGLLARERDLAILVTAAEWMDTRYGRTLRSLLCGRLGALSIHAIDARSAPFPGTLSTAAITVFAPGRVVDAIHFEDVGTVEALGALSGGDAVPVAVAATADRWPPLPALSRRGNPRVGDVFRVSRGQVTGMNKAWIAGNGPAVPERFLFPCITGAKEVFEAAETGYINIENLLRVIDLPRDLSSLNEDEALQVEVFLTWARRIGADRSYIARHRSPWWSVRLREPAPIICTYMARRPPAFVMNTGARLLNVAHGLYPRVDLAEDELRTAVMALNSAFRTERGRVYAGGLTKFEPGVVEAATFDWWPSGGKS